MSLHSQEYGLQLCLFRKKKIFGYFFNVNAKFIFLMFKYDLIHVHLFKGYKWDFIKPKTRTIFRGENHYILSLVLLS